eukprot:2942044-Rhodomonas_salina.1
MIINIVLYAYERERERQRQRSRARKRGRSRDIAETYPGTRVLNTLAKDCRERKGETAEGIACPALSSYNPSYERAYGSSTESPRFRWYGYQ